MIKIDDRYSIYEGIGSFTLFNRDGMGMAYPVARFSDPESALDAYVRQVAAQAFGGDEPEAGLKAVVEAVEKANKTIEAIYR